MSNLNHKWKDNVCVTCGCKREYIMYTKTFGVYTYSRSGHTFDYRPDCIDWELENSKTID
jgi:hypothetical protein